MTYLLKIKLITPGPAKIGENNERVYMVNKPEDAAIIVWQHKEQLPPTHDLHIELYRVDFDAQVLVGVQRVPEVRFG